MSKPKKKKRKKKKKPEEETFLIKGWFIDANGKRVDILKKI
jgi:hypothetical protein